MNAFLQVAGAASTHTAQSSMDTVNDKGGDGGGFSPDATADEDGSAPTATQRSHAGNVKSYFESYYGGLLQVVGDRRQRQEVMEEKLREEGGALSAAEQQAVRDALREQESEYLRKKRQPLSVNDFEHIRVIGRGAFGEVRLVRKLDDGEVFAMKIMRKTDQIARKQVDHVRSEQKVLTSTHNCPWWVKCYYSFQDEQYLYLVMEYVPGGDIMTYLIKLDIFSEELARFLIAESILAVESLHESKFIHRDLKPDNLLLDSEGHIVLSDFGLSTRLETRRDNYWSDYKHRRGSSISSTSSMQSSASSSSVSSKTSSASRHGHRRRALIYSVVGTPNYIAVETFQGSGYSQACDWWSIGAILFEMLAGFPPFAAPTARETYQRVLDHETSLQFPHDVPISAEAKDLIRRLLVRENRRLGRRGAKEIKEHPWFAGVDWENIRTSTPPLKPVVKGRTDTRNFDEFPPMFPVGLPESLAASCTHRVDPSQVHDDSDAHRAPHAVGPTSSDDSVSKGKSPSLATKYTDVGKTDLPFLGFNFVRFKEQQGALSARGRTQSSDGLSRRPPMHPKHSS